MFTMMMEILSQVAELHRAPQGWVAELPGLPVEYARIQVSGRTGDMSLVMIWDDDTVLVDDVARSVMANAEDAFMVEDMDNHEHAMTLEIRSIEELYRVLAELA